MPVAQAQVFFACRMNDNDDASSFWSIPELDLIQVKLERVHHIDINETLLPVVCIEKETEKKHKSFLIDLCKKKSQKFEHTNEINANTKTLFYCASNKNMPMIMPTPGVEPAQKKCQWLYGVATISEPQALDARAADKATVQYAEHVAKKIAIDHTWAKELYDSAPEKTSTTQTLSGDSVIDYLTQQITALREKGVTPARKQVIDSWQQALEQRIQKIKESSHDTATTEKFTASSKERND
jgi:hypothetical protein